MAIGLLVLLVFGPFLVPVSTSGTLTKEQAAAKVRGGQSNWIELAGYTGPLEVIGWEEACWEFDRAPRNSGISDRLGEISIPTLVLTGETDEIVASADSVTVSELIAGSELVPPPEPSTCRTRNRPRSLPRLSLDLSRRTRGEDYRQRSLWVVPTCDWAFVAGQRAVAGLRSIGRKSVSTL